MVMESDDEVYDGAYAPTSIMPIHSRFSKAQVLALREQIRWHEIPP